jgi:hypothetical protein
MKTLTLGRQYYFDDRMFVVEVEPIGRSPNGEPVAWALTTRRNVPGYAVFRRRMFETRDRALAVLRHVAPQTPRVSLEGLSPVPAPTFEQHNRWLREQGLPPLG